jgi:hypothetical protein
VGDLIDIVGHFGTTFSYATVGSEVARALLAEGRLGNVTNLDPEWHGAFGDLSEPRTTTDSRFVLLFTAPNHYIDAYASQYGHKRSALYMSPNTDRLAPEHAETCAKFGLAIAPSQWCERVVRRYAPDVDVAVLPLGVSDAYTEGRQHRMDRLLSRASDGATCQVLHMSTDQSWPGRKGTEELLSAWRIIESLVEDQARLTLHVPPALHRYAEYMIRDYGVDRTVKVALGDLKGSRHIEGVVKEADLIVAPSRCEGFGMMFLASLVAGVPLVCTYNTGQKDFLRHAPGWLGVSTDDTGKIDREDGLAPVVEPHILATTLAVAVQPEAREQMLRCNHDWLGSNPEWGTWKNVLPLWVERLTEWMEES